MNAPATALRYAIRTLRRTPAFTLIAISSLGLGIGAAVTMISIVNATDLRRLPIPDAERVVALRQIIPRNDRSCPLCRRSVSPGTFEQWAAGARSFDRIGAISDVISFVWDRGEGHRLVLARETDAAALELLGAHVNSGRLIVPSDLAPNAPRVAVLDYALWHTQFSADPNVVGTTMSIRARTVNGANESERYLIVGVLEPRFPFSLSNAGAFGSGAGGIWVARHVPDRRDPEQVPDLFAIGHLAKGVGATAAAAELMAIQHRIADVNPALAGTGATVQPLRNALLEAADVGSARLVLLGVVTVVLLIALVNVTNLFLSRAIAKEHEFSVRAALGASRGRLIGQVLAESLSVAVAGGALGTLLATWSTGGRGGEAQGRGGWSSDHDR